MKLGKKTKGVFLILIIIGISTYFFVKQTSLEGDFSETSTEWHVSNGANSPWQYLADSNVTLDKIKFGDFNGDGKTDAFVTWRGKWYISYGANSPWQYVMTSNVTVDRMKLGDFNGDGKTDLLTTMVTSQSVIPHSTNKQKMAEYKANKQDKSRKWYVSYNGDSHWQYIMTSNVTLDKMILGDFNGDGKTDVLTALNISKEVISKSTE